MSKIDIVKDPSLHEDALLSEEHEGIIGVTKSDSDYHCFYPPVTEPAEYEQGSHGRIAQITAHQWGNSDHPQRQNLPGNENPHQQGMTLSQRKQMQINDQKL